MIDQATGIARYDTPDGILIQKELTTGAMRSVAAVLDGMTVSHEKGVLEFSTDSVTLARLFSVVLTREDGSPAVVTSDMVDGWPWDRITNQMVTDFFVFAPTLTTFIHTFAAAMLNSGRETAASGAGKGLSTGSTSH